MKMRVFVLFGSFSKKKVSLVSKEEEEEKITKFRTLIDLLKKG